jgi:hypothetical protein
MRHIASGSMSDPALTAVTEGKPVAGHPGEFKRREHVMPTDRQALAALDDIDRILRERIGRPLVAEGRSLNEAELSAEYWEIRLRLDTALTLIDKIPVYGKRIATAVRFLMQICDRSCTPAPETDAIATNTSGQNRRGSRSGGHIEIDNDAIYGHAIHRPRALRKEASEHHRPSPPTSNDRGLPGLL